MRERLAWHDQPVPPVQICACCCTARPWLGAPPPPDVTFVLDLTDRSDAGNARIVELDSGLPRLASSRGCGPRNLPVPFALKGFSSDVWQEALRRQGPQWRWSPSVEWSKKAPQALWRGAARAWHGPCGPNLHGTGNGMHPRSLAVQLSQRAAAAAVEATALGSARASRPKLRLDASFTRCQERHELSRCIGYLNGSRPSEGVRFNELAASKARCSSSMALATRRRYSQSSLLALWWSRPPLTFHCGSMICSSTANI